MALIIYPDVGYDSFITVANCDIYLANNVPTSQRVKYDAITIDSDKEILIRQATTLIKSKITLPATLEQNLQDATAYLVNYSIGINMTNDDGSTSNLKRKRLEGVIDKEWFSPLSAANSFPDIVDSLLKDYGVSTSGAFVLQRA